MIIDYPFPGHQATRRITTTTWTPPTKITHIDKTPEKRFSPVKAGTKTAHVVFVLDDSYSMQYCRDQTISGFNEFLAGQRDSEVETLVSLYKFDGSKIYRVYSRVPAADMPDLDRETYNPRGGTNLLDAIGEVMFETNDILKKFRNDSVNVVILTDGEENSSRMYDNARIKGMVEQAEGAEWTFQFLGANVDAFSVGGALGFRQDAILQYSTSRMDTTFAAASRMTRSMNSAKAAGMDANTAYAASTYTDEERKEAK